ncbi:MAG: hypothetical protein FJ318_03050 [SAR202 cluster bacterium]|nr:hypothetical protein [SAR202 cluster bacterium]
MTTESAAPRNARTVYTLLIVLTVVAAIAAAYMIGFIAYEYATRVELREPAEQVHAALASVAPA